jgi:hypothetical protein
MPLADAPYRASGLVLWRKADVRAIKASKLVRWGIPGYFSRR